MKKLFIILVLFAVALPTGVYLLNRAELTPNPRPAESENLRQVMGATPNDATDDPSYAYALPGMQITLPDDHGPHPDFKNEWWYFVGYMHDDSGNEYGFQVTVFRNKVSADKSSDSTNDWQPNQVYMQHIALTDVSKNHYYAEEDMFREDRDIAFASAHPLRIKMGATEITAPTGDFPMQLTAAFTKHPIRFEFELDAYRPPVLQGDHGYSRKGQQVSNASGYYSYKYLTLEGELTLAGTVHKVSGNAWLDREWSSSALDEGIAGWDWFAIMPDDDTRIMLYRLRTNDGTQSQFSAGKFVGASGNEITLNANDFTITSLADYRSNETGITYPSDFKIEIPKVGVSYFVKPIIENQEHTGSFRYWEGLAVVNADVKNTEPIGRAYIELTGY